MDNAQAPMARCRGKCCAIASSTACYNACIAYWVPLQVSAAWFLIQLPICVPGKQWVTGHWAPALEVTDPNLGSWLPSDAALAAVKHSGNEAAVQRFFSLSTLYLFLCLSNKRILKKKEKKKRKAVCELMSLLRPVFLLVNTWHYNDLYYFCPLEKHGFILLI